MTVEKVYLVQLAPVGNLGGCFWQAMGGNREPWRKVTPQTGEVGIFVVLGTWVKKRVVACVLS